MRPVCMPVTLYRLVEALFVLQELCPVSCRVELGLTRPTKEQAVTVVVTVVQYRLG